MSHSRCHHLDLATRRALARRLALRIAVSFGDEALFKRAVESSAVTEHNRGERVGLNGPRSSLAAHVEPMVHGAGRNSYDEQRALGASCVVVSGTHLFRVVGDSA